jgi:prophage DNA circulation protein
MTTVQRVLRLQQIEIEGVIGRLLDNLLLALPSQKGLATYAARRQIGDVRGGVMDMLQERVLITELLKCFNVVREVGATAVSFASVRGHLLEEDPTDFIPKLIVQAALLYCLAAESRIVVVTKFICRDDAEVMLRKMGTAFEDVKEFEADQMDSAVYRALVDLAASVAVHLATTALLLPRIVQFDLAVNYPGLKLSQLLYYDPSRVDELIGENKIVHPCFFPREVKALSQ